MWNLGRNEIGEPVGLREAERAVHLHALGGPGSGKSTFLHTIARQIIAGGRDGMILIDPHGTLYDDLLSWLAFHRLDRKRRIRLFEPKLSTISPGFNPLRFPADAMAAGVSSVVQAFAQVWGGEDPNARPRLTRILRATLYLLAEHELTLAQAKSVLALEQKASRNDLGRSLKNTYFRDEWVSLGGIPDREWVEFVESTENRLTPFLASPIARRMVGRREHVLDLADAMENGDIVLVNLQTSDQFTEEDQRLVGTLLINDLRMHALRRQKVTPRFYALIDECYKFLNQDVESMLVEVRKRGVHLVLAHQNLGQLRDIGSGIYETVMAIPNKVVFGRLSAEDARTIASEVFCGEFDLETPKKRHTMPVVVGHRRVWLESMSSGHSRGESTADSDTETTTEGKSAPETLNVDDPSEGVRLARTAARGSSRANAWSETETETSGRSESFQPIIQERPTQLYSLDELAYQAAARIKDLTPGHALVKADGKRVAAVAVKRPRAGLRLSSTQFLAWKSALLGSSPHIVDADVADRLIDQRSVLAAPACLQTEKLTTSLEPTYGRRVARGGHRGKA